MKMIYGSMQIGVKLIVLKKNSTIYFLQAHKKVVEERNLEIARKSKENAEKQKAERLKMMENYEEPEWMKMSNVEESLQQLEANLDQSHGETGVRGQ